MFQLTCVTIAICLTMALKFELVLIVYKQNNEQRKTQYRDLIPKSEKRSKLKDA